MVANALDRLGDEHHLERGAIVRGSSIMS